MIGIETKSRGEQFYDYLKNSILHGELRPGEKINIESFIRTFKISRSPIKTAIDKLVGEGFLVVKPQNGTFVAKVEKKELIEYLQIRFMIECYILETEVTRHARAVIEKLKEINKAALLAATNDDYKQFMYHDEEFHRIIISQSTNRTLVEMYNQLHVYTGIMLSLYQRTERSDRMFGAVKEHEQIIIGVEKESGKMASNAMRRHASIVIKSLGNAGQSEESTV